MVAPNAPKFRLSRTPAEQSPTNPNARGSSGLHEWSQGLFPGLLSARGSQMTDAPRCPMAQCGPRDRLDRSSEFTMTTQSVPETFTGITTKLSPLSVAQTLDRLQSLLASKGMKVFGLIDQRAEARDVGLELRETVLVQFGSPLAGTPVMDAVPLAAMDLPLKILIWQGDDGTMVSYVGPDELAARYGIPNSLVANLAGINAVTDALVSVESHPSPTWLPS